MINKLKIAPETNIVSDPVTVIEQLADQSAQAGYYALQDANLVLAETLRELQMVEEFQAGTGASFIISAWYDLVEKYQDEPNQTAKEIINYLRRSELKIPMTDDEFEQLEQQLCSDANDTADTNGDVGEIDTDNSDKVPRISEQRLVDEQIVIIERLADQAAAEGLYGLQDANLLLAEALLEAVKEGLVAADADFLTMLSGWSETVDSYRQQPKIGSEVIISLLRHPVLKIPMGDDEFTLLQEQLATEIFTNESIQEFSGNAPALAPLTGQVVNTSGNEFSGSVSRVAQELVDLLLLESEQVRSCLQDIIINDRESVLNGLQRAGDELERFANAAKTAGFEGLARICTHVNVNLQLFLEQVDSFTSEHLELLLEWLGQVQEYLPSFNESNAGQLAVAGLTDEQWALPLSFEELAAIMLQIRSESLTVGDQFEAARTQTATDDDISIALPDDVNQELMELLLLELPVHTQQFSEAVQRLQSNGSEKDVEVAQRVAHTLKGCANTVGIKGIAVLTHHLEDILIACASEQKLPGRALANALLNASDCLENMSEALLGFSSPPDDAKAVLQEILDWANRIDKKGMSDSENEETLPETQAASGDTGETLEKSAAEQLQTTMVRVAAEQIESLFRLSGENIILNGQAQERLRRINDQLQAMQIQFALLRQIGAELEQLIDLKDLTGLSLDLDGTGFDALEMDQYNELHTASRRMAEAAIDAREIGLDINKELEQASEVLQYQQRLAIEAQEVVMQTRLVPVASITPRLQRSLRQTCRLTDKQSELVLTGEELLVDGDTLNAMVNPLMHILRNAVDHGIESESDRLFQGKPGTGRIAIGFELEGNTLLVRCLDDGRGLDYGAIRAAAEKRGVMQPGQEVSEEELKRFILRPNFSTRTVTTQTSGRGVGMDAVYAQVIAMGGTLTMESESGRGMTIELRIPLPVSLTYALLVNVGQYRIAIANKGISQIHYSGDIQLITEDDQEKLLLEGITYPVAKLDDLLHIPGHRKQQRPHGAMLLVQNEEKITAVLIDSVVDTRDVVIKSLGQYIGKIPGFIGATILGDGTVTPVLDMPELLRAPARPINSLYTHPRDIEEPESMMPTIMVVDDSLSQRRALEQLLSDAGYKVRTARDGIEAVNLLAQVKPDLVLTDLEMPRMNGIELSAHIRAQSSLRKLPVIMITSRTTQKHRQMTEESGIDFYLAKPVRNEDLLVKVHHLLEQTADTERKIA
ncbi:MAG: hybrid sensor histidine kinase/response regulator [Methylobacter sp.]